MISPSDDEDDQIISDLDEAECISFTKEECFFLLEECRYSFISYENPVARSVISRISKFVGDEKFTK